jgi:hypothetical protein
MSVDVNGYDRVRTGYATRDDYAQQLAPLLPLLLGELCSPALANRAARHDLDTEQSAFSLCGTRRARRVAGRIAANSHADSGRARRPDESGPSSGRTRTVTCRAGIRVRRPSQRSLPTCIRSRQRVFRTSDKPTGTVALDANRTRRRLRVRLVVCANRTRPTIAGRTNRPSHVSRPSASRRAGSMQQCLWGIRRPSRSGATSRRTQSQRRAPHDGRR